MGFTGDTFAARVAGSILTAAGLPELITRSIDEYEQLAKILATDAAKLQKLRSKLVEAREAAPYFNSAKFTRDLEHLFEGMIAAQR